MAPVKRKSSPPPALLRYVGRTARDDSACAGSRGAENACAERSGSRGACAVQWDGAGWEVWLGSNRRTSEFLVEISVFES